MAQMIVHILQKVEYLEAQTTFSHLWNEDEKWDFINAVAFSCDMNEFMSKNDRVEAIDGVTKKIYRGYVVGFANILECNDKGETKHGKVVFVNLGAGIVAKVHNPSIRETV
jgi:hypothetical protein